MTLLSNLDLDTDPAALRVVKDEAVAVEFAAAAGELMSLEGPNRYQPGDAIVTGATGERWVVSRERFDAKYRAEAGRRSRRAGHVPQPARRRAREADA